MKVPSTSSAAFTCPHCGAFTQQSWFTTFAFMLDDKTLPMTPSDERAAEVIAEASDADEREEHLKWAAPMLANNPAFRQIDGGIYVHRAVPNVHFSQCIVCKKTAVWLRSNLIWPQPKGLEVQPNPDLPSAIAKDFLEATSIAHLSPRSAAALLRLCIEKLCIHLGKSGKIDQMIAALVVDGLHPSVSKALDVVRVIGNESVHPGTVDLNDDPATVESLFRLVNIIAERMLTEPRQIDEMFESLPPNKLKGIEDRNNRALKLSDQSAEGSGK